MILYGASGHAKVIIDICKRNGEIISVIIDDNKEINSLLGYSVTQIEKLTESDERFIISIGNNITRKKIVQSLNPKFFELITD